MSSFGINTYGDINPRVGIYAVSRFLTTAAYTQVLERYALTQPLPKNSGHIVRFRRWMPFQFNTNALVEGVTPAPDKMNYEDISAIPQQYGGWTNFTDVIMDTHEDPILNVMTEELGKVAGAVKEQIIWQELTSGTNVLYSGDATERSEVDAPISEAELIAAQRFLKASRAKPLTRMLSASANYGTEPVAPAFLAFGHTNLESDLRQLPNFVPREKYASGALVNDFEIGKFQDIRFVLTPDLWPFYGAGAAADPSVLSRDGVAVDVYPLVIIGQDAYGVVPLRGMDSASVVVKNPTHTYEDPLAQRGFASWKMWYVAVRLNEQWMVRIESAVSAA